MQSGAYWMSVGLDAPMHPVAKYACQYLFVQGESDDICPIQDMWKFYGTLPEPNAQFAPSPGAGESASSFASAP